MTDQTTQQTARPAIAPPPAAIVGPTLESVKAAARALLLELDGTQAATEVSQALTSARAQIVASLASIEAHYATFEAKAASAVKAAEARVATGFAFSSTPAPAAAPAAQPAATPAAQ
jgi:hypothetical protein